MGPSGQPVLTAWGSRRNGFFGFGDRRILRRDGIGLLFGFRLTLRYSLLSFSNGRRRHIEFASQRIRIVYFGCRDTVVTF